MTNTWGDIKNANLVVIIGGNAAEAHPCGFKWVTEAKAHNKAELIVVDPRFTRSAAVSDLYVPIRAGTDIAWLCWLINYLLTNDKIQHQYVKAFTNASFLVKPGGWVFGRPLHRLQRAKARLRPIELGYQIDAKGYAEVDETLRDPRCAFQLMKAHYSRYTIEMVERICGSPKDKLLQAWQWMAETAAPDRAMTSMYALGWTQHSEASQNIRTMAIVQLLLGNTEDIAYFEIEGAGGLVKAETCDQCRTYLKIVIAEKDADVVADDLATLALDMLVDEVGWRRSTPNPFLVPRAC